MPENNTLWTRDVMHDIFTALPKSNGSMKDVVRVLQKQGKTDMSVATLSRWRQRGNADIKKNTESSFAAFVKAWDRVVKESCSPEKRRMEILEDVLLTIEATCECGSLKGWKEDGERDSVCPECRAIDKRG